MAIRKKYTGTLTRLQWRALWTDVQQTQPGNRTHEDWLRAANRELMDVAEVRVGIQKVQFLDMKHPDESVTIRLSYDATCGCKLAMANAAKGAAFGRRESIRSAAAGFGKEFGALVVKALALEDSKDLEEDAELNGVPAEEEVVEERKEA